MKIFFEANFVITGVKPFRKVNFQLCSSYLGSQRSISHMCLFIHTIDFFFQKAEAQLAYELQAAKIQQKIRNEEIQIQVCSFHPT